MFLWIYAVAIGFSLGVGAQPLMKAFTAWRERGRPPGWDKKPIRALPSMPEQGLAISSYDARFCAPGAIQLDELNELFTRVWGSPKPDYTDVLERSFAWILVHEEGELRGFANVAWDGGPHFFLLDLTIDRSLPDVDDIFSGVVKAAVDRCRKEGGWMRIDAPEELLENFFRPLGFKPVKAGLINLQNVETD